MTEKTEQTNEIINPAETPAAREAPREVSQEIKTETTLFAEPVFHFGHFTVTNSLINSWVAVLIILIFAIIIRRKINTIPRGIQNYIEVILDSAYNLADSVTNSRRKSTKFIPIILPLFIFILINNWLGLVPGVGTIGLVERLHGENIFIPYLRAGTADLNLTLALAIMAVLLTHIFGVAMTSSWKHFNRFIGINLFLEIPRKMIKEKDFSIILVNPIKFFVGLIEIVGEFAKVASLSFRLFGNVFAGEVLLVVMASISAYFLPIPFMLMELVVGLIQALIFAMLTLVFLTIMTTEHEEGH